MISPIAVAFVTACTALVSSVIAPMITMRMGRAQIRASVISNNRQRWIETLRDLIAAFCAQVTTATPMRKSLLNGSGGILVGDPDMLDKLSGDHEDLHQDSPHGQPARGGSSGTHRCSNPHHDDAEDCTAG
jgi:hypothetical protein